MTEGRALLLALCAHLALLALFTLSWTATPPPLPPAEAATPVDFVDIADAPRTPTPPAPSRPAAPQHSAPPPPSAAAPSAAEPPPAAAVPPPQPAPPQPPRPEPTAAKAPRAPARPLDTQTLANLIDKALPKARSKPLDTSQLAEAIAAAAPKNAAIDPRAAATLAQAIRQQVAPCWNPPIGGADATRMTVTVRAAFGRDGAVVGTPQAVGMTGQTAGNADLARAFRESAVRAVLRCSPLQLPAKLHDLWKTVDINFDPATMG